MTANLSPHLALAATFQRSGWHKLGRRELELKLGRSLTKFERRAFDIAAHIDSGVESIATQSSKANQRIANAKGLRPPKPVDPNSKQKTGHVEWAASLPEPRHERNRWSDDPEPWMYKKGGGMRNTCALKEVPRK